MPPVDPAGLPTGGDTMMDSGTEGVDAGGAADIPDLLASSPQLVTHSDGARPTESPVTHDRAPEPPPEPGNPVAELHEAPLATETVVQTPPHPPPTEPHAATDRAEAGTVRNDDDLTTV